MISVEKYSMEIITITVEGSLSRSADSSDFFKSLVEQAAFSLSSIPLSDLEGVTGMFDSSPRTLKENLLALPVDKFVEALVEASSAVGVLDPASQEPYSAFLQELEELVGKAHERYVVESRPRELLLVPDPKKVSI